MPKITIPVKKKKRKNETTIRCEGGCGRLVTHTEQRGKAYAYTGDGRSYLTWPVCGFCKTVWATFYHQHYDGLLAITKTSPRFQPVSWTTTSTPAR